jgi:hypothetical protein
MWRHHAALASGKLTRVTSGVNLPPLEVITSRQQVWPSREKDMTDWLYHLPIIWMALVVFAVASLVTGVIYGAVLALATGGRAQAFKAMSPVMLTPLAVVFGLLVGFLAAQVWSWERLLDARRRRRAGWKQAYASTTRGHTHA